MLTYVDYNVYTLWTLCLKGLGMHVMTYVHIGGYWWIESPNNANLACHVKVTL